MDEAGYIERRIDQPSSLARPSQASLLFAPIFGEMASQPANGSNFGVTQWPLNGLLDICGRHPLRLQPELDQMGLQISARIYFTARPAVHESTLTAAKNTTAIQASESGSLFVTIAAEIVSAAIPDIKAIARPHR